MACSNAELLFSDDSVLDRRLEKIDTTTQKSAVKIVTTGTIDVPYKNQQDVIKAMAVLKRHGMNTDIHYYLIGPGDKTRLASVAQQCGLENNVHFLGSKSHEDVFAILDGADLYIQPSKLEGLPRALVEAMSRALPAFGTKVGGIPELLTTDCLYSPGNIKELAYLISSFTKERMRQSAVRNFNRAKDFQKTILDKRRSDFLEHVKQIAERKKCNNK